MPGCSAVSPARAPGIQTAQLLRVLPGQGWRQIRHVLLYPERQSLATFKGWSPSLIDGDSVTSGYDGSRYFVKDDGVWQMTTVGGPHPMKRIK
jgi:hypothetical protein